MRLSIIIPVYNVEKYIIECLDSIYKSQNNINDFEVICVDDKGTDNSIKLVEDYILKNNVNNLRVIEHEVNQGLSEARNTGIKESLGEYICFLDSDDLIEIDKLDKMIDIAKNNDLDIIEGDFKEISESTIDMHTKDIKNERKNTQILSGDGYFYYLNKNNQYYPMSCSRVYKSNLLKSRCLFKKGIKFEDEEFSPRAIISANRVMYVNEIFYIYRRRDDSITTGMMKNNDWIKSYLKIIDFLLEYVETIKDKKSYEILKDRIANIALSILKNPIAYGTSKENLEKILLIIKDKKIYMIPQKSKNIIIKLQGILMQYPNLFIKIYGRARRNNNG